MDNFCIDITCEYRPMFDKAIEIAFHRNNQDYKTEEPKSVEATHYVIDSELGFVFMRYKECDAIPFPFPINWQRAADLAWDWLTTQVEYPPRDHHDSDITEEKGWRVYTEFWGHVGHYHSAIVAVKPAWAWFGK